MGSNPDDLIAMYDSSPYNLQTQGWVATTVSGGVTTYDINYAYLTSSAQVSAESFTVPGTSTTYANYYTGDTIGPQLAADFDGEVSPFVQAAIQNILAPAGTVADTNLFSDVANISFTNQADTAASVQIEIGTTTDANSELRDGDAIAGTLESPTKYNPGEYGDIWLNDNQSEVTWSSDTVAPGSEAFEDLIHELGHSLGLIHPTNPGGNNTLYYTIMTGSGWELPGMSVGVSGLQLDDIRAIQSIYGANYSVRSGTDMYGVGHGFGDSNSAQFVDTIWDGGGTNIIDASSYTGPSVINLNQVSFSSIGPGNANGGGWTQPLGASYNGIAFDNVAIAYGTVIQNAIGTQGATVFIGNLWDDVLAGAPSSSGNLFYSDQSITPAEIPGVNWSYQAGTAGSQWTVPTAQYIAAPYDLSDKGAVLIGDGIGNTFISGQGYNVIDGGYNKSDITNATQAALGGSIWGAAGTSTYWDNAYQFTGDPSTITIGNPNGTAHNISGVPLANIADSASTGNTVDYSKLSLEDSEIIPGSDVGILLIKSSLSDASGAPEYTVVKNDAADGEDTLINIQYILGSGGDDTFVLPNGTGGAPLSIIETGTGHNTYILPVTTAPSYSGGSYINGDIFINDTTGHGNVVIQGNPGATVTGIEIGYFASPEYWMPSSDFSSSDKVLGITVADGVNGSAFAYFDMTTAAAGTGVTNIEIGGVNFGAQALASYTLALGSGFAATTTSDLYSDLYGTSAPTLLPGPVYDPTTGQITGMAAPSYVSSGAGNFVGGSVATEIDHDWVITGYAGPLGGPGDVTISIQTYIAFASMSVAASDVRIVWGGTTSDTLTVYAVSEAQSFTIPDFKGGMTIYGIGFLDNTAYDAFSSHLTGLSASSPGNYSAGFSDSTGVTLGSSFAVTYYFDDMFFSDGTSWNMQSGPLTFTSALDSQSLYSRDGYNDTLVALNDGNILTGSTGNTTMVAGPESTLYQGTGNDTDVFSTGASPSTYGGDAVELNASGTTSIVLHGITPAAVTMWDTAYGEFLIQYSSTDIIRVYGGTDDSTGFTMGSLAGITFDDTTHWDLTGGLTLTAAADSQAIYGTVAGGDTLIALGTGDYLTAYAGTETLVAGPGAYLYNGTGTNTDVFSAGTAPVSGGGDFVYENSGGGTTTIAFHGIDPGAVTMWDDSYNHLLIQFSSTDQITVVGGTLGSDGFSLGNLTQITFDDIGHTTWDMTGGLNLVAVGDSQYLYGTTGGGDTLIALGTGDYLTAYAGMETLVAGPGAYLYNGTGTNTDVFSAGTAPVSGGGDFVYENSGGGTTTIAFHGIDPGAVTMWDDSYNHLLIQFSSTDQITVLGGTLGAGGFSDGNLAQITFDDIGHTSWDMTGGLNLVAASDYQYLYGTTGGGDTLTAAGTGDYLTAYAGDSTLVAGPAANLYNGTGNDIDVINAGSSPSASSVTIHANAGGGSDNIIQVHDAISADFTMWDDTFGNLTVATLTDQFTITGGTYSGTTGFAVGTIDHIALDDSSTIGLQGSLNLTAVNDSQSIYGTGHGDNLTAAGNYDFLYGIAGNNTMTGDSGTTYFNGGSGNDTMVGGSGTNYMTMGTGDDEIKIEGSSSTTTVTGFDATHDTIHLEDVMSGFDALTDALSNWVQKTESGSNTVIAVDPTGTGSFTAGPQVTLNSVTGLDDIATLVAHGVVHV